MDKLFRQVNTSDRIPTEYQRYDTNIGNVHFLAFFRQKIEWWLEPVELPSEEILDALDYNGGFKDGVKWVLNTLKGEKR